MPLEQQKRELETLIRARYPIIYIATWEETRALEVVREIAHDRDKRVMEWSVTAGLAASGTSLTSQNQRDAVTKDPLAALDRVLEDIEPAIYVFKDVHHFLGKQNVAVVRRVREIAQHLKHSLKTIVMISPVVELPSDLEKEVTVLDFDLPGPAEFGALLERIQRDVGGNGKVTIDLSPASKEKLIKAALGLTLAEAENVFAKALVASRRLGGEQVEFVFDEKKQIIRKTGLLEYIDHEEEIGTVGGLDLLKDWLAKRRVAFSDEAAKYGLAAPRGMLMLGVQGCGKSLTAKAVSKLWGLPLLRFDVGRMFGSLVGSSEQNVRRAIQIAESVAPAILWIDEIDKAFARQGANTDSGTSTRVFGTFLTWLAEKKAPVFVVATANDISNLPPELLRKGRLDEIFFVDLPNAAEREEIFRIHLTRRKRDPKIFELAQLAEAADGFSGAEIEEAVNSAMFDAFYGGREVTSDDILKAVRSTVPLSRTMEEPIERLREWSVGRARNATSRGSVAAPARPRKIEV